MPKTIVILLIAILIAGCAAEETVLPQPVQPKETQVVESGGSPQAQAEETVTQAPTEGPTVAPTPTPAAPIPPFVLHASPEPGEEQPPDAPIEIAFDQPMDRDSVEKAFAIEPGASVDGTFEWVDDQTVRFAFKDGFQRGQRYRLRVTEEAASQAGLNLTRPFELRFSTVGFLEVTNVQPADGTGEVLPNTVVTVMFNRPVVPLEAIGEAGSLPDPLTFTPPVTGQGEWLNTATYRFTPTDGFQPATDYTARLSQGLSDAFGSARLEDDFEWRFTTISPAVAVSIPASGDVFVSPTPVISVAFNQLMDHDSVTENLLLVSEATGQTVPGQFAWVNTGLRPPAPSPSEEGQGGGPYTPAYGESPEFSAEAIEPVGVETVTFSPLEPLELGQTYQLMVPKGVKSRQGLETGQDYTASFRVIPPLEVAQVNPPDGEQFADIYQSVEITFNAPLKLDSVVKDRSVIVESDKGFVDENIVFPYLYNNDTTIGLNLPMQENTAYTVTVTAGVESRYGQPLGRPLTYSWKTLRRSPYVRLVSPKIATYNGYQSETYVYMTVRNVGQVHFNLYRLAPEDFLKLAQTSFRGWDQYQWETFRPKSDDLLGQWQQTTQPESFVNYVYKVDVSQAAANGEPLPPGIYYLEALVEPEDFYANVQVSDPNQIQDRQVLIVSRSNLTIKRGQGDILAWLTDLQSGRPIAGAPLTFFGPAGQQSDLTDAEGVARFNYEESPEQPNPALFIVAGQVDSPDERFAVGSNGWSAGIDSFDFENLQGLGSIYYGQRYASFIYSARPLYRPGQTVYFKGILRQDDDARYRLLPGAKTVQVTIHDAQYREIYNKNLPLNDWGTFNDSLVLADEASLGAYQLTMTYGDERGYTAYAWNSFNVAEYRKPEFLVKAATDKAEYQAGDTIELSVETEFFFGGPVANATVRWTLLSDPYFFQYQGPGYYDFTFEESTTSNDFNPAYGYGFGEQIANGSGVTDANGRFSLEVPADLTGRLSSQTFTFDVAVTGLNNQEVATQARAIVHKGAVYVGLRPAQYVGAVGLPNQVEALVVDWDGKPVANQQVDLVFAEHNWYSSQQLDPEASRYSPDDQFYWQNIIDEVAVFTTTVTTDNRGQATASFSPDKAGSYKVYARVVDQAGHELFSSIFMWVSGSEYVNWGQQDHDRIELIANQEEYSPGDTATILIPHPYSGTVTALITLERGHIYDYFVTELKTNSDQIEIPITEAMSPNIYVSAMIMKGMASAEEVKGGLPGFKMGYARLNIDPGEKVMNISLTPGPPAQEGGYLPGQKVEYQIKVTDHQGQPLKAELSLALIDKAVLTLFPETPGRLMKAFWERRALQVQTGSGLTLALDRINRALDEKKGGGGGEGGIGPDSVRQNFADTALWVADLVTDENGEATVETTLPDNLTTWVLLAKGVSGADTLVGEASDEIVTSKPLLVRSVAPRFLVEGDEVELGLIVQNNTTAALNFVPSFEAEGLTIQAGPDGSAMEVEPGEELKLTYRATVGQADEARLTMGAKSTEFGDAVAFSLPIYRPSTPETVATVGALDESGTRLEGIALPRSFDPAQGSLTINIEPSLAAGMQKGLDYLEHFPYECAEQTVSRFLPNIFTYRAYRELGLDNPELASRLPNLVNIGIQRLQTQQHFDGGWGWWINDASDPLLTAYVLLGLAEARRADFTVEQWVTDNAVAYLQQSLVAPKDMAEPWQANRQAFILYALAEAGQGDLSRSVALFEQRQKLDQFGRAYLAMAIQRGDKQAGQLETLVNDLTGAAVTSASGVHWEEAQPDFYAMNTDLRSTAIVIAALSRIAPDHPLLPQAVRWLMTNRSQEGHWSTTQETAWSIIGLTDWLVASGELSAEYAWQVSLNGQELGQGEAEPGTLDETTRLQVEVSDLLADTVNRLAFERDPLPPPSSPPKGGNKRGDEAGHLYYGAYLTYFKPVQEVKAIDRGIIVSRQYHLASPTQSSPVEGKDRTGAPISEARVGDFIQVKLTLIAPSDLRYVLVEDYLPAGAEALDSSLATTSLLAARPQLARPDDQNRSFWYFTHTDLRDEKAVLFAGYLPKGVYEYTYTIRAALPGEYHVIPTHAEQMYFPEVFGRSDGALFRITE